MVKIILVLTITCQPIPAVEEEKDLGVTFDQKMKFSNHVDGIWASANRKLGVIKRTFSTMDKTGFMLLYKSVVRPSLEYCSTVWHPYFKKDITNIEKGQRRATRQVQSLTMNPGLKNVSICSQQENCQISL